MQLLKRSILSSLAIISSTRFVLSTFPCHGDLSKFLLLPNYANTATDGVTLVTRGGYVILFSQYFVGRCRHFGGFFHSHKKLTERFPPLRSFKPPESLNELNAFVCTAASFK